MLFSFFPKEGLLAAVEAWSLQYLEQQLNKTFWFPWTNRFFIPLLLTPDINKTREIYPAKLKCLQLRRPRASSKVVYLELSWFPALGDAEHLTEQHTGNKIVGYEIWRRKKVQWDF